MTYSRLLGCFLLTGIASLPLLLTEAACPVQRPVPTGRARLLAALCPVYTPARGYIAAFFVADGEYVKRGQLVAKLECANGTVAYVNAPATGRISWILQTVIGALPAHNLLGTIATNVRPLSKYPATGRQAAFRE